MPTRELADETETQHKMLIELIKRLEVRIIELEGWRNS
jgi:hypothetical protein